MPRHKIPGDRLIKNAAGTAQTERNVVELSGSGFGVTTPDANQHVVAVNGTGPPVFEVPTTDLVAWLKVSELAGAAENDEIASWPDLGSGGAWTEAVDKPRYRLTEGPNGGPAVDFAGGAHLTAPTNLLSGATAGEYFAIVKVDTPVENPGFLQAGTFDRPYYDYSDGKIYENFGKSTTRPSFTPTLDLRSNYRVYNVRRESGTFVVTLDGDEQYSDASTDVGFAATPILGTQPAVPQAWSGWMTELLVYDRVLTAPERSEVMSYLFSTVTPTTFALTPVYPTDPYYGRSKTYIGGVTVEDVGIGFFDFSTTTIDLEGGPDFIDGTNTDLANGTIVFSESGLYSVSWYMESPNDTGAYFTEMQLVPLHQFHVSLSINHRFSFQKMRGGATPYWSAHSNITDWFVGANEDPVNWSQILLKYNRDPDDPLIPWSILFNQLTITKIA